MSSAMRRAFVAVLFLVLLSWVYEPILRSGPLGPDYEVLSGASRLAYGHLRPPGEDGWRRFFVAPGVEGFPISAFSLSACAKLFTDGGLWSERAVRLLRLENLLLLIATGLLLGAFVQRLLLPWTGSEHSTAAGFASAMLFTIHPLCVPAVASPDSHDLLIGGLLAAAAILAFLRGRQERRDRFVLLAAVLTLACAFASDLCWMLAPALAITEFASAHRYRPLRRRINTGITTLLCFGAISALPLALRTLWHIDAGEPEFANSLAGLRTPESAWRTSMIALERFGFSVLPVNAVGRGATGLIIGVGLMLVAVQPAMQAARSAPRLWAGAIGTWAVLMLVAVGYRLDARVHSLDLSAAASLLPAAAVMAAGMGLSATALTGRRRFVIPALAIIGAGQLARADARCVERAAIASDGLLQDLAEARRRFGLEPPVLVLDPPRLVSGHPAAPQRMEWMLDPALVAGGPRAEDSWIRGIDSEGFRLLAISGQLDLLRAQGLCVLVPQRLVEEGPAPPMARRLSIWLEEPGASVGELRWTGDGRSPELDIEALDELVLIVEPQGARPPGERPVVHWEASTPELPVGSHDGAWLETGGQPRALFDLSSSFGWLLGNRVRRVELASALQRIGVARLKAGLDPVRGATEPRVDGDDWVFSGVSTRWQWSSEPLEPEMVLTLVDRVDLGTLEVEGRLEAGHVRFRDVEPYAAAWRGAGNGLIWSLEERLEGNAIARTLGR